MLAMDSRTTRFASKHALPLTTITSMLAPTVKALCQVPDLILVQARVRARSASRGSGCRV